jgi:uncharacterized surface protein with fasciclin (FAS1) repeats
LEAAVIKANLQSTLAADPATLTVFAPTNDAFKAAGFATEAAVTATDAAVLANLLKNHVLSTNRASSSLVNGEILTNLAPKTLVVSKSGSTITINSSVVTGVDLVAKNGRIHTVGSLIVLRNSILDVAIANTDLSLLNTAIANVSKNSPTNLANVLMGTPSTKLTVFAPNNTAFTAAGYDQIYLANSANATAILNILTYHVLNGQVNSTQVPVGPNASVTTYDGIRNVYATNNINGVFINGIKVVNANVAADNGVVHVIGTVLIPPTGTVTNLISTDTRFSKLLRVIQYTDANTTPSAGLATLLDGTSSSPFTFFAPINSAFDFLDTNINGTLEDSELATVGGPALANILRRHVALGIRTFSSDLFNGQTITVANSTLGVIISGNTVTLSPTGGTVNANIVTTNIVTNNGVVHTINAVLR